MVETLEETAALIGQELALYPGIELCLLYGSAAADTLRESSDIDLAVGSETGLSADQRLDLSLALTLRTGREVTVLDIDRLEGVILQEVLSKGIRLRNDNPPYLARLIIKMYDFAEDLLPYQMAGIRNRIGRFLNA